MTDTTALAPLIKLLAEILVEQHHSESAECAAPEQEAA